MPGEGKDNAEAIVESPREQTTSVEQELHNDVASTPPELQLAIMGTGRNESVPATFKPQGKDAEVVGTPQPHDLAYKPPEVARGKVHVESTLGNDTEWAVNLPEVKASAKNLETRDREPRADGPPDKPSANERHTEATPHGKTPDASRGPNQADEALHGKPTEAPDANRPENHFYPPPPDPQPIPPSIDSQRGSEIGRGTKPTDRGNHEDSHRQPPHRKQLR